MNEQKLLSSFHSEVNKRNLENAFRDLSHSPDYEILNKAFQETIDQSNKLIDIVRQELLQAPEGRIQRSGKTASEFYLNIQAIIKLQKLLKNLYVSEGLGDTRPLLDHIREIAKFGLDLSRTNIFDGNDATKDYKFPQEYLDQLTCIENESIKFIEEYTKLPSFKESDQFENN